MKGLWIGLGVVGVIVLVLLLGFGSYVSAKNTMVAKDQDVKQAFSEIDVDMQRRADLIPNLVETVKGYAAQERSVLVEVTQARASATQVKVDASTLTDPAKFQQYAQAQDKLSGVLGRLMMIQENYPDLKSNQNFLALQSQLEGTENRISIARNDYNEAVRDYNTTLRTFPTVLWAKTFYASAKPMVMFVASDSAQAAPTVSFNLTVLRTRTSRPMSNRCIGAPPRTVIF